MDRRCIYCKMVAARWREPLCDACLAAAVKAPDKNAAIIAAWLDWCLVRITTYLARLDEFAAFLAARDASE